MGPANKKQQSIKREKNDKKRSIHVQLLETVSKANKASGGIIIHFPSWKAQLLPPRQWFTHPLPPFPAYLARPTEFHTQKHIQIKINLFQEADKCKYKKTRNEWIKLRGKKNVLGQIFEASDESKDVSQQVNGQPINLGLFHLHQHLLLHLLLTTRHFIRLALRFAHAIFYQALFLFLFLRSNNKNNILRVRTLPR